jgi:hypothetical protein
MRRAWKSGAPWRDRRADGPSARAKRRILRAAPLAIAVVALGPVSGAMAERPALTITSPANGSVSNNQMPSFTGTTSDPFSEDEYLLEPITVRIYRGLVAVTGTEKVTGTEEVPAVESTPPGLTWSAGPAQTLAPGTYTAQAEQSHWGATGYSAPVTFTIDTRSPQVTLTPTNGSSTGNGSQVLGGTAGTHPGDLPGITVQLFAGSSIGSQLPLQAVEVRASGGIWSATFGGLNPGTYTARAEQSDEAGNTGMSAPVTFTLAPPPPPPASAPPLASFKWFPSTPVVGEPVSLVSSSTDQTSPLTTFAWALATKAVFKIGKPVLTTSFTTPGDHVVRLLVTAADGLSSVASGTIHVIRRPLTLMAPFPVVRIAGILTPSGVNLSLITAQVPRGARVRVTCRGDGCPTASESRLVVASSGKHRAGMVTLVFRRFERTLAAGVILEIKISKPGRIGKYTRFMIRHGKLPTRVDGCIDGAGVKPIACPTP